MERYGTSNVPVAPFGVSDATADLRSQPVLTNEKENRMKRLLPTIFALAALASMLPAQTKPEVIYTISGTLGPVQAGSDPLMFNGLGFYMNVHIPITAYPTNITKKSVDYPLATGNIWIDIGDNFYTYFNAGIWKVKIDLNETEDTLHVTGLDGSGRIWTVTAMLEAGSWTTAVLTHIKPFSPAPQSITAPASMLRYTFANEPATEIGLTGTISEFVGTISEN